MQVLQLGIELFDDENLRKFQLPWKWGVGTSPDLAGFQLPVTEYSGQSIACTTVCWSVGHDCLRMPLGFHLHTALGSFLIFTTLHR